MSALQQLPLAFFGGTAGGGEILLIAVVALLLFGSKNLPRMARNAGRTLETLRRAARDVQRELLRADVEEVPGTPAPKTAPEAAPRGKDPDVPLAG